MFIFFSRSHMSKRRMGDSARMNGTDSIPRPFVIGVAGGTASGKVCDKSDQTETLKNKLDCVNKTKSITSADDSSVSFVRTLTTFLHTRQGFPRFSPVLKNLFLHIWQRCISDRDFREPDRARNCCLT